MARNKSGSIPNEVKAEIAKELGVYDTVEKDGGWGNVSSRDCGNIVKKAVERASTKIKERN